MTDGGGIGNVGYSDKWRGVRGGETAEDDVEGSIGEEVWCKKGEVRGERVGFRVEHFDGDEGFLGDCADEAALRGCGNEGLECGEEFLGC